MSSIDARLIELGLTLPEAAAPAANYVPYRLSGTLVFVSGQVPLERGKLAFTGKLGGDLSVEDGQEAAGLCALNILAQVKHAAGNRWPDHVACLKLGGFVNCTPEFGDHPKVINGASDLMVAVLGEEGRHARFAVGAPSLPFNVAVEIDAVFEIR